jgi:hypothetical protein
MSRLKLPPYAKAHALAAGAGNAPANAIAGDWSLRNRLAYGACSWRCVVPPEDDPAAFDWRWCAGFDVIVLARSKSRLDALGSAVASAGPRRVVPVLIKDEGS